MINDKWTINDHVIDTDFPPAASQNIEIVKRLGGGWLDPIDSWEKSKHAEKMMWAATMIGIPLPVIVKATCACIQDSMVLFENDITPNYPQMAIDAAKEWADHQSLDNAEAAYAAHLMAYGLSLSEMGNWEKARAYAAGAAANAASIVTAEDVDIAALRSHHAVLSAAEGLARQIEQTKTGQRNEREAAFLSHMADIVREVIPYGMVSKRLEEWE